jgi:hypothetical protein
MLKFPRFKAFLFNVDFCKYSYVGQHCKCLVKIRKNNDSYEVDKREKGLKKAIEMPNTRWVQSVG